MPSYAQYEIGIIAETTIYQNEVRCRVSENDFNYSLNPSAYLWLPSGSGYFNSGYVANNLTGSEFRPYATTVGLFNEAGDLLVVGKLATPYPIPQHSDITFIIRYDS